MSLTEFRALPPPATCRRIAFDEVQVLPAEPPGAATLLIRGIAPCLNTQVSLMPLIYVRCPDYWAIEVIGCLPDGICLPAIKQYEVTRSLAGIIGSRGIEVLGASTTERIDLPGGCS